MGLEKGSDLLSFYRSQTRYSETKLDIFVEVHYKKYKEDQIGK
jgi:hypothetical protein